MGPMDGDATGKRATGIRTTGRSPGLWFAGGAAICLLAAGTLLWWHAGEAVFTSMVTAAIAWCF